MTEAAEIAIEKARMRPLARRMRADAFSPNAATQLITHYTEAVAAQPIVAGYWPLGGEIDPRPLMAHLAAAGVVIALPCMLERGAAPAFLEWKFDDALEADAFGVLAPVKTAPPAMPALILVPLLAFDRLGGRLGQGGGHYDRVLATMRPEQFSKSEERFSHPNRVNLESRPDPGSNEPGSSGRGRVVAVGLAFAGQEMPVIPREPHDQRLDWVITEREAIDCR